MQKNYSAGQKSLLISIPKHRNASQQLAIYRGDYSNLFVMQMPKSKGGFGMIFSSYSLKIWQAFTTQHW